MLPPPCMPSDTVSQSVTVTSISTVLLLGFHKWKKRKKRKAAPPHLKKAAIQTYRKQNEHVCTYIYMHALKGHVGMLQIL